MRPGQCRCYGPACRGGERKIREKCPERRMLADGRDSPVCASRTCPRTMCIGCWACAVQILDTPASTAIKISLRSMGSMVRVSGSIRSIGTKQQIGRQWGGLCFGGIEARSMPRGKSRPKDRKDYGRPRSVAMSTRRSKARARFATSANCATVASSSARRTRVVRSSFASRRASANCSRGTGF